MHEAGSTREGSELPAYNNLIPREHEEKATSKHPEEGEAINHKTKTLKEPVGTGGAGLARPQRKSGGLPIARDSKNEPERFYEQ